jgi:uncharacterized protein YfeS
MTRIVLEVALKYVVENTKYDGINTMNKSKYFNKVFPSDRYTNFSLLKTKFTELIKRKGTKNEFNSFDLDNQNQIIHNYNVGIAPVDAQTWCEDLISVIEFILDDELELLKNLDITKL